MIIGAAMAACAVSASAQMIDLNNNSTWSSDRLTEEGYTPWVVGQCETAEATFDGVTITISNGAGSAGRVLKGNWWKDGVQNYSKLVGDGVAAYGLTADGNTPQVQEGAVIVELTISGLTAGEHSLMAYHNNTDGYSAPNIDVYVDGQPAELGVEQTSRAQKPSQSGMSYVRFSAEEGRSVTVTYRTVPEEGVDYTQGYNTTTLFINALVFDRPNPKTTAADPTPAAGDEHAAADGGRCVLSWTAATSAVRHHLYMGESAGDLAEVAVLTEAEYEVANPDPMKTYTWRVDEEDADGNIYEGDVWTFRPRRLAFPGAEGYGRFAIGGRGGEVYHVTSLDDDAQNPQPGTLRYGITRMSGPRTIVFDVAGVITLTDRLTVTDKYVTIAGQTAPGRGIMLKGKPFGMQSDGITRFIRVRVGGADDWDGTSPNENTSDGMGMAGNDHSIMDHCSVSWTIDEAFSSRNARNVTLQRTLISEALNQAGHKNYTNTTNHGYAATIGGDCGSYHHNLMAHCEGRNWSMSGGLDGGGAYAGRHDMFNNVCYNWGSRATDGGTHEGQFVGNYYKMGPATTQTILLKADLEGTGTGSQSYFVHGNIRESTAGVKTADAYGNTYKYTTSGGQVVDWTVFVGEPFFESYATVETAEAAFRNVLSDVGCNQPEADNHDRRMVAETLIGTTSTTGSRTGKKGLIDKESDAEGFGGLNIVTAWRPAAFDRDGDGIPDWFEKAAGTSTTAPNNNADRDADGYTDLEEYLNWMAEPHFFVRPGEAVTIDLKPYFAGYEEPALTLEGTAPGCSVSGGLLTVNAQAEGLLPLTVRATDLEGGVSMTRSFNFCVTSDMPELETTDGIEEMKAEEEAAAGAPIYSITGMKVAVPQRGIYIKNGRKYVVR